MDPQITRRNALRTGGLALVAGLEGCASDNSGTPTTSTATSTRLPTTTNPTTTCDASSLQDHAVWFSDLNGEIGLPPAIADGSLYVGRTDGRLVALDPASGETNWRTSAGVGFSGFNGATPTVANDTVYVVPGVAQGVSGRGFEVVALEAATGDERWSHSVDETSFLTLFGMQNGHVLAATHDDAIQNNGETLVSLHPDTGDTQWTATVGDPSGWGIGAGGVYVESYSGLRAVALANGDPRWTLSRGLAGGIDVTSNTVITAIQDDHGPRLRGFDPTTGDVQWRGPDWTVTSHATANDIVYAGGEKIGAYATDTGTEHWAIRGSGYVVEPPVGGRLFARLESGIHARDPDSGDLLWGTNATLDSPVALGRTRLAYVAAPDDPAVPPTLVVRNAATGDASLAVTFETDTELTHPLVYDRTVIVATRDGQVYALTP